MSTANDRIPTNHDSHLLCPQCGFNFMHPQGISVYYGHDAGAHGIAGFRGDVIGIAFAGECGHAWELCIGLNKGTATMFTRKEEPQ